MLTNTFFNDIIKQDKIYLTIIKGVINMNWELELYNIDEKPLDKLVEGYSYTSIFRKIAFVGDSLSSGEFETRDEEGRPGYHDLYEYSWGQYIARKNGLTAYNFSRGGMTAQAYMEYFAEENDMWNPSKACQAYVIALGVNDVINCGMEPGEISDIDADDFKNNKPTFLGNYAQIITRYKEISPDAKFFLLTIPKGRPDEVNERVDGVNKTVHSLAEYFENTYVIDLNKYAPTYDDKFKEHFYLYGHMSPAGYIFTAKIVDSYIDYIIRHNPQDFKNVGFINTDIKYK